MHSMTIKYRVGDGPEQTEQLTSDVATMGKALEWAPQQMALRLMRDGVIKTGAEMTTVSVAPVVEIQAEVRDNSETVTDYAFSRHRSPNKGVVSPGARDRTISTATRFLRGYTHYQWHAVNQGNRQGWGAGQRCRFDMLVNATGKVVHLFHTEYWTRVACGRGDWCHSYATYYTALVTPDGEVSDHVPYCDEHTTEIEALGRGAGMTALRSERLLVGQHD